MKDFPDFMKNPENRIKKSSQFTKDIEGFVYDGKDGSQMAFWTSYEDRRAEREEIFIKNIRKVL
ncbi:MAG: hypothetical protein ABSG94_12690 [Brevinematales bacterium]|jgi:hypothetical protein